MSATGASGGKGSFAAVGGGQAPFDGASFLSRFTFSYALPLFRLGYGRPLREEDMPPLAARDGLEGVAARLSACWERERARREPSLARALVSCFRRDLVVFAILFPSRLPSQIITNAASTSRLRADLLLPVPSFVWLLVGVASLRTSRTATAFVA